MQLTNRKKLLHWCISFFAGNILFSWLIGLRYLPTIPWITSGYLALKVKLLLIFFFAVSYLGQLGFLTILPALFIIALVSIFPRRHVIFIVSAIVMTFMLSLLITDTTLYTIYRFHINGILLDLVLHSAHEQMFDFSNLELAIGFFVVAGLIVVELIFAYGLWRFLANKKKNISAIGIVTFLAVCMYFSYALLVFNAGTTRGRVILESARVLPLYTEFFAAMLPMKDGKIALETVFQNYTIQPTQAYGPLHYPLQPLQFVPHKKPLNVIIIGIDTWRFDMLDPKVMPNLYQFSKQSLVFSHHFSGGNATGPGIFSLFYGLPAAYWTSMEKQHRGPVLIDELLKRHYQMNILSSAGLTLPPFNRTVFSSIKNVSTTMMAGKNPYARDLAVTAGFLKFVDKKTSQPFFSFLFYDSSHSYCAIKNNFTPFEPSTKVCNRLSLTNNTSMLPYLNRYKNAVHLVDQQVGIVLSELKKRHLLDNTVVIITGDHGEEFNDNHLGYWGHTSNFTRYQVQTPLVVYWPGEKAKLVNYPTTHYDIAPMLMERLLGCKTPANNYSIGTPLLAAKSVPYEIVGSYIGFGVVEKDRITSVFPTGNFQITQPTGQVLSGASLRVPVMQAAFSDLRRFYHSG